MPSPLNDTSIEQDAPEKVANPPMQVNVRQTEASIEPEVNVTQEKPQTPDPMELEVVETPVPNISPAPLNVGNPTAMMMPGKISGRMRSVSPLRAEISR